MSERTYTVQAPATIAGYQMRPGDTVAHSTIMRRTPHQLGSLLRLGIIVEDSGTSAIPPPEPGVPDFDTMSKPGLKTWAKDNGIELPEDVTRIADIRAYLKERTA